LFEEEKVFLEEESQSRSELRVKVTRESVNREINLLFVLSFFYLLGRLKMLL
jgi:hypothetical protein